MKNKITFMIDKETNDALTYFCKDNGIKKSFFIEKAIEKKLKEDACIL